MTKQSSFTKIPYDDRRDFLRVRDLIVATTRRTGDARHWMVDRWEFCRAFAHTMMGTTESWPSTVGLWIDDQTKARAHIRAFGYEDDPRAAITPACWAALRTMPDWRDDLELFALGPGGPSAPGRLGPDVLHSLRLRPPRAPRGLGGLRPHSAGASWLAGMTSRTRPWAHSRRTTP